jgi:hypothetical protein
MRAIRVVAVAAAMLAAVPTGAWAAAPRAGQWTEVPHTRPSGDQELHDAFSPGPDDVWAVGHRFVSVGGAFEFRTYAQHWDGSSWTWVPTVDREGGPATNFLFGVGGSSPADVWAVGYSRNPGQASVTLVERWDGSAWSIVPSPSPSPSGSYLLDVSAASPTDAWAVGEQSDPGTLTERPLVLHWDGASWSAVPYAAVAGCTDRARLTTVDATARPVLVGGTCRTATGAEQGFVARRTATGWALEAGAGTLPAPSTVEGLDRAGADVWAVGSDDAGALTVRRSGGAWAVVPTPHVGDADQLLAVDGRGARNVWAVGLTSHGTAFAERLALHWDGSAWRAVPAGDYSRLEGVAFDGTGDVWAVGSDVGKSLILRGA